MPATGGKTLHPLQIPEGPLVPEWAREMVRRMNLLTQLKLDNQPALTFGEANANLVLASDPSVTGGESVTYQQLVIMNAALTGRVAALETALTGATIVCNGDGTITLTFGP